MRFVLRTRVARPPDEVFPVFGDASFVESLAPPLTGLRVERIGLEVGDEIEVRFTGLGPRSPWVSRIVELERDDRGIRFVDESVRIPWPLASLRHQHGFLADGTGTLLVDDVTYAARPSQAALALYPSLRLSFGYRRHVYRRRFGAPGPPD